jgi:hypothetical protein
VSYLCRYLESGVYVGFLRRHLLEELAKVLSVPPEDIYPWPVFTPGDLKLWTELKGQGWLSIKKQRRIYGANMELSLAYSSFSFCFAVSVKQYKRLLGSNSKSIKNLWGTLPRAAKGYPLMVHTYKDTPPPGVDPKTWMERFDTIQHCHTTIPLYSHTIQY